ncbi:MAG TPA: hypothetical protein VMT57_02005 [Candidatus Thermoplasmatota archaeon]|nr:hypothetical protein [Candidatus Thermoplasmatota archaeon]
MPTKNIGTAANEKNLELKKWFKDMNAVMEQWKFSVETTKEGTRIELHAVALIKQQKK